MAAGVIALTRRAACALAAAFAASAALALVASAAAFAAFAASAAALLPLLPLMQRCLSQLMQLQSLQLHRLTRLLRKSFPSQRMHLTAELALPFHDAKEALIHILVGDPLSRSLMQLGSARKRSVRVPNFSVRVQQHREHHRLIAIHRASSARPLCRDGTSESLVLNRAPRH